jgi:aspartyl-tRNA(Asn)/glutamyl-tRNA(Gln) amidotransferase subunit A
MTDGPAELTADELLVAYGTRRLSPVEVVDVLLARIGALDPALGAFTTVCADRALDEARAAERDYARAEPRGPLAGVPFAVKDLFDTADVRTTYGSPMFADHTPTRDAEAVRRVRDAGAILIGKTQTHEFAWGITSVNELMGTSRNPWRPERISGGSSGGSAVALAARLTPLAVGSDTGGSIRVPSGFCGTVGLKPTFGRVSAEGVWPLAPSLDHPGPMARTPADAALLLGAMERTPGTQHEAPAERLDGFTVAVCPDLHSVELAEDVQRGFDDAVRVLGELGANVVELPLSGAESIHPAFLAIQRAEAHATHTRAGLYPARADEYGADVRRRLRAGASVTLSEYVDAIAARERVRGAFAALFERAHLLVTPVAAGSPIEIEEHRDEEVETGFRELVLPYTVPQDLVGLPACAVRAGFDDLGIPVGVQLTSAPRRDHLAVAAAHALFAATPGVQEVWPADPVLPGS